MIELIQEDGYKVFPPQKGKVYMANSIPLHWLVYYLSRHKMLNKELSIKYIKENYHIDISSIIDTYEWDWIEEDVYSSFIKTHPREDFNNTRRYFESKGRTYYLNFSKSINYSIKKDQLNGLVKANTVHHIYPLVYGGTNHLENLIQVSTFSHDILHENSREKEERFCHQAVDYLWYLYCPWITDKEKYIFKKYKLNEMNDMAINFKMDSYFAAIKNEMVEFYERINKD